MIYLQPSGKTLLVKIKEEEPKKGSLLLTIKKDMPRRAIVQGLGDQTEIKVICGDEVLLSVYGGLEIDLNNEKLLLVNDKDVLGVIKNG